MPRQGRIDIVGSIYHVITRGINRDSIFADKADREEFVERLGKLVEKTGSICYGWALMPNHFHLIVRRGKKPISELMSRLLTGYALYFNRRHQRRGYLFQNRYKSILCQEEVYLLELIRYVHLNPLRAGLVKDIQELAQYPWGGYSAIVGQVKRVFQEVDEVLSRFGSNRRAACRNLAEFMNDGVARGKRDDLTGGGLRRSAGGWAGVLGLKKHKEYWRGDERILGEGQFVEQILKEADEIISQREQLKAKGYTLAELVGRVCQECGIDREEIIWKGRQNRIAEARAMVAYLGTKELGYAGKEVALILKCSQSAVSFLSRNGEEIARKKKVNLLTQDRPCVTKLHER